jgi:hypothetical protein
VAHYCLGVTAACHGDCITARDHLERSLALDDPRQAQAVVAFTGRDNAVVSLTMLLQILVILGYADKARVLAEGAIRRGNFLSHAPTMAFAHYGQMNLCLILRDYTGFEKATAVVFMRCGWAGSRWGTYKNMGFRYFLPLRQ